MKVTTIDFRKNPLKNKKVGINFIIHASHSQHHQNPSFNLLCIRNLSIYLQEGSNDSSEY